MTVVENAAHAAHSRGDMPTWSEVERGFWVGSRRGDLLGTVECHSPHQFLARNAMSHYVGEYASLELARTAVLDTAERNPRR